MTNKEYQIYDAIRIHRHQRLRSDSPGDRLGGRPQVLVHGSPLFKQNHADPSVTTKYIKADNSRVDIEEISSPGSSGLSYHNSSMTWQFNWQTKNLSPGLYEIIIKSKQSGQTDSYPIILRK